MSQIFVIHPGNRGISWCDMESSRFFVRDDKLGGESFKDYAAKFLQFPFSVFSESKIRLTESFRVFEKNEIELVVFPNKPGWIAVSSGFSHILQKLLTETTVKELLLEFEFKTNHLHYLLAALYSKGVISTNGVFISSEDNLPELNRSDEMALIELTRACNLRCKHCFNSSAKELSDELEFNEIASLVDKIIASQDERNTEKTIMLSGGEPFLREDIFDIINYINQKGYCAEVLSNGVLLTPDIMLALSRLNIKLRISLDGCTPETHEWMRGKNTFEKTVSSIKCARDYGINIGITTSISNHNIHELERMLEFVDRLNVNFFQFILVNQLGRAVTSDITSSNDAYIYDKFYEIAKKRPDFKESMKDSTLGNMIACNITGLFFHHCGLGLQKNYYVQANGDMFPCRATILPELKLGNIRELDLDSFIDFTHPKLQQLQQLRVDDLNPVCSTCNFRYWCSGDCRGETYQSTGSFLEPTLHCDQLISGFETVLWLSVKDPDLYFEKSNAFYRTTGRVDLITQALQQVGIV